MALADVLPFSVDANTLCIWDMQEASASTVWDNKEGDSNWDCTPSSGNEPQVDASVPNANFARSRAFDNNDFAQAGDPSELPTGAFSIELMLYLVDTDPSDTEGIICKYGTSGGQRSFYLSRDAGANKDKVLFGVSNAGSTFIDVSTAAALSRGVWHYIACTYEPSTALKIYVDGSISNTNSTSIPASMFNGTDLLTVGRYNSTWGTANALEGKVVDIRISNSVRTSTEVTAHWAGTDGGGGAATYRRLTLLGAGS